MPRISRCDKLNGLCWEDAMPDRPLTPKQQAFVLAYAACGNATEAARQAGYKKPLQQGSENLEKLGIQRAIDELTADSLAASVMMANERQQLWTEIARDKNEQTKDRLKASELLGKAQGDFIERTDGTVRIVVERKPRA